jgi:hypothetical protein
MKLMAPLCVLCDRYLEIIYNELIDEGVHDLTKLNRENENNLVVEVVQSYIPSVYPDLIIGAIEANFVQSQRMLSNNYSDLGTTDYGEGEERDLAILLKKVIGDRFVKGGYKAYYPPEFYMGDTLETFADTQPPTLPHIKAVAGDPSEPLKLRPRKWLWKSVGEFTKFCHRENHRMVGIMPWKLFKICYIPMVKDPHFLGKVISKLTEASKLVDEIRQSSDVRAEFEVRFPPSKRMLARRAEEDTKKEVVILSQSMMNDFASMCS